jgi:hypothetical protein
MWWINATWFVGSLYYSLASVLDRMNFRFCRNVDKCFTQCSTNDTTATKIQSILQISWLMLWVSRLALSYMRAKENTTSGIWTPIVFFYVSYGRVRLSALGTSATLRPIVPALDGDECGTVGGMSDKENRNTRRKPAPVPLCPSQIPHDLTWARTLAVAVSVAGG